MINLATQRYAFAALAAAALFGVSTPLAKTLLAHTSAPVLAGLLYLGSGIGLALARTTYAKREAPLTRADWPWLAGATLAGGVAAPLLLLWGLAGTAAASASLLLNLEGVLTALLAAALFREAIGARVWLAALVMLAASLVLSWDPSAHGGLSPHALAVVAACLLWALDNNLTRNIAAGDATQIAMVKGLVAGSVNLALGLAVGGALPGWAPTLAALALGAVSYGASLVLFVLALRHLGAARTSAHFGTAPFFGAILAVAWLGEPVGPSFAIALTLMVVATWLVLAESHGHAHAHATLAHAHRHVHDEHHRHAHRGDEGPEPHAHPHVHEPLTHSHPHLPDLHHRHPH